MAVNGSLSKHQQDFLSLMFKHLEQIEAHKKVIEASIDNEIATHFEALALLCSIPGIDVTATSAIIAGIGTNMKLFPSSQHIWTESRKQRKCRKKKELPYNQRKSLLEKYAL